MATPHFRCYSTVLLGWLAALLLAAPATAQEGPTPESLARQEAAFEQAFVEALEAPESEPMVYLSAWGQVLESAAVLEHLRARVEGGDSGRTGGGVRERVFERWRQEQLGTIGPEVFEATLLPDPEQKLQALTALLARHPDRFLVVSLVVFQLRQRGQREAGDEVLEAYLARHPEHASAYSLLLAGSLGNQSRQAEILQRWAQASPGSARLVRRWMSSSLPTQEPEATARLLDGYFESRPSGPAALGACLDILHAGEPRFAAPARSCVARLAGDPDSSPEVAERATAALGQLAAAEGNWAGLLQALDSLEPSTRWGALVAAARGLPAPERCPEQLELLRLAAEEATERDQRRALVSAAKVCARQAEAQSFFLELLRGAPAEETRGLILSWASRLDDRWIGPLPDATASLLLQRLQREPEVPQLYEALDVVYQVQGDESRRFDLLQVWRQRVPERFGAEQVATLAEGLWLREQEDAAIELLQQQAEERWDPHLAETLWALWVERGEVDKADRLAARLLVSDDPWRRQTGHLLTARSALLHDQTDTAIEHYWQALAGDLPQEEVALELLVVAGAQRDDAGKRELGMEICKRMLRGNQAAVAGDCAAGLLAAAGESGAATERLADLAEERPENVENLRQLARQAQRVGRAETSEEALRKALELDPRNEASWTQLGAFLEAEGRVDELLELLERSRRQLTAPPILLSRAAGRGLTAAGEPRQAIQQLLEARSRLPESMAGYIEASHIDRELRVAYRVLGESLPAGAGPGTPEASPSYSVPGDRSELPEGASGSEMLVAAEALYSGSGGRYDPAAAVELYRRATSLGDPRATFRLALLRHLGRTDTPPGEHGAEELYQRSVAEVSRLAGGEDPFAQYLVGTAALVGLGGAADFATARDWLERAAAQGEGWAWHNLAWMEDVGRGFSHRDSASILDGYRRASKAGLADSMVSFASDILVSGGDPALCKEGLAWLQRSAGTGHAQAAAFLGTVLLYGRGDCVLKDPAAAAPWLEKAAAARQPRAALDHALARLLAADPEEGEQAMEALRELAATDHVLANETLAFLHATGALAVPRNGDTAATFIAEAARLGSDGFRELRIASEGNEIFRDIVREGLQRLESEGDAGAAGFLAHFYFVGLGDGVGADRVATLARRGAEAGHALAMRTLSQILEGGRGVERSREQARRWRLRCAEAGNSFCMLAHAHDRMAGRGVQQDLEAGRAWLRRAAETGNYWAVADYGNLHDEGWYGLPRDARAATAWKRKLADLGDPTARGWLAYHGEQVHGEQVHGE